MKKSIILSLMILLSVSFLVACRGSSQTEPTATPNVAATLDAALLATQQAEAVPTATPNVAATVEAAVAATAQAEAALEAEIDAAVQEAVDEAVEPAVEAEVAEYAAQTEAELAAMIEEAVNEAVAATQSYSTATSEATADNEVTASEVQTIEVQVQGAEEALAEAEQLIASYYAQYGDLAEETLNELSQIEEELSEIEDGIETMNATLTQINQTLEQGLELAEESIAQLQTTADAATATLLDLQTQTQTWASQVQSEIETRVAEVQAVQPSQIASNREEALQQASQYLDLVNNATVDGLLSSDELAQIIQSGSNAAASLNAQGGPQLQNLSTKIDGLTQQLARGNLQQAQVELGGLQSQLPQGGPGGPNVGQLQNGIGNGSGPAPPTGRKRK